MHAKAIFTALLISYPALAYGQGAVAVAPGVRLPADSAASRQLLASLSGLLRLANKPELPNAYLAPTGLPAEAALLDELRDLDQSRRAPDHTPYSYQLLNAVALDSARYLLQVASMGLHEGTPVLRATVNLLACRAKTGFAFASPLRLNAAAWRSTTIGNCRFRYQTALHRPAAKAYARQVAFFDKKLQAAAWQTELFCCDNLPQALQLLGVAYKADYAGYAHNSLSARAGQQLLVLYAEGPLAKFDPHDLWHQRLRNVLPASRINKPVDEGCAYLYGGSWGIGWPLILRQFQAYAAARPGRDWLGAYDSFASFGADARRPLLEAYVLNALLIQDIERTQGFAGVRQLLGCGKYAKDNENYFRVLEQVAGITKANFNARVTALIQRGKP